MEEPWDLIINVGHVVPHEVLGLRQPQQELLHRPGRQGDDLRLAHAGRHLRHREQPGQPGHADAGVFQQGRGRFSRPAARPVRAGRDGPQCQRTSLVHTGVYVGDDLETYLQAARQSREQNITVFDEPVEQDRVRDAGRRVRQHLGRQQGGLSHADGAGRRRRVGRSSRRA